MAQKTAFIPEVGEIILAKRKDATNMRLSVSAAGKVRVSMPSWVSYSAGINFAAAKVDWIKQHLAQHSPDLLQHGALIGKSHRLQFIPGSKQRTVYARQGTNVINIHSHLSFDDPRVQEKALHAAERSLKYQATKLLLPRLDYLAHKHGFTYNGINIRKLTGRWGSCTSKKDITLSLYLVQLPWELIDYVLLHELLHTRHLNHGKNYWSDFLEIMPDARKMQKEIKQHKPVVTPS